MSNAIQGYWSWTFDCFWLLAPCPVRKCCRLGGCIIHADGRGNGRRAIQVWCRQTFDSFWLWARCAVVKCYRLYGCRIHLEGRVNKRSATQLYQRWTFDSFWQGRHERGGVGGCCTPQLLASVRISRQKSANRPATYSACRQTWETEDLYVLI